MKKIVSWALVILWASFIFFLSSMNASESDNKSMKAIDTAIESTIEVTNKAGITDTHPSESEKKQVVKQLNNPLRKVAHASEYFVLVLLLINALLCSGVNGRKVLILSLVLCFAYSCFDEYHQTFVVGRTGQFSDCLIDTAGGMVGCLIYYCIY